MEASEQEFGGTEYPADAVIKAGNTDCPLVHCPHAERTPVVGM